MRARTAIASLSLLTALAIPAAAQAVLTGRITSDSTNQPVADAEVLIASSALRTVSDASGRYRLAGIPLGTHELEIRRIGFAPVWLSIVLEDEEAVELDIALKQEAFKLPELTAEAARIRSLRLAELEHRQRTGGARHITAEDLA
ncbi:MAG: carboxypeptidase-like regulatory domain-containing protein, partial [Gemmatimonadales bacterium]